MRALFVDANDKLAAITGEPLVSQKLAFGVYRNPDIKPEDPSRLREGVDSAMASGDAKPGHKQFFSASPRGDRGIGRSAGHFGERREAFRCRRDLALNALNAIDGVRCLRPEGAFCISASCAGPIGRHTPSDAESTAMPAFIATCWSSMTSEVVPGGCFVLAPHFRLSYPSSGQDRAKPRSREAKDASKSLRRSCHDHS